MLEKASGKVVILASQVSDDSPQDPGSVINYANDLDIAQDGTVYFTTSCDIPVVPNALGFWDTFAVFTLTMLQVRLNLVCRCPRGAGGRGLGQLLLGHISCLSP